MGGSGLFHEDHVPTIPAFSSLDHATYTQIIPISFTVPFFRGILYT